MSLPRFHGVPGLTAPEYEELRGMMRSPRAFWPELNRTDLKVALNSALYHANLFAKVEQALKALTSPRAYATREGRARAAELLATLETRDLYLMRDVPVRGAVAWYRNKARLAFKLDAALSEVATREFRGDDAMALRVEKTLRRWQSKRLPGVARRLKPGPKTGKRKRKETAL